MRHVCKVNNCCFYIQLKLGLFVVSTMSLSLSYWYRGSGVVLDCIDS